MRIDRSPAEAVFARVPELAEQTDPVLRQLDRLLDDDGLDAQVRADLSRRYPPTLCHGRHATPVEVVLRLLLIQHLDHWSDRWSDRETEQRVADSLVVRWCCRVSFQRVPDATTLVRWAHPLQPATLHARTDRVVALARHVRVTSGRKLRSDGTVVETRIHSPTARSLLVAGVRGRSRLLRRSTPLVQEPLAGVRDAFRTRLRTRRRGLQTLYRLGRRTTADVAEQRQEL